jgi:hypothetical protein
MNCYRLWSSHPVEYFKIVLSSQIIFTTEVNINPGVGGSEILKIISVTPTFEYCTGGEQMSNCFLFFEFFVF